MLQWQGKPYFTNVTVTVSEAPGNTHFKDERAQVTHCQLEASSITVSKVYIAAEFTQHRLLMAEMLGEVQ